MYYNYFAQGNESNDLQNNQQQYLNILTKLQQQAEYTITFTPVSYPSTLEVSKVRGKAYLLAKKQQFEQQQAFQTKQRQQWENIRQLIFKNYPKAVFRDSTESKIKQVHLLANRDARVITTEELSTWQTECSYWQITLSEQLPPYHFV